MQTGDTVRLKVQFTDWGGQPAAPDSVNVTIYNGERVELFSQELGPGNQQLDSQGTPIIGAYYYDYTPPAIGLYYYEFVGVLEGTPALQRGPLNVKWL